MGMRELRRAAWEREQGRCAATGVPLGDPDTGAWDLHHRRPKGMGGTVRPDTDTLSNLVALLSPAHNMGAQWLPVDGVRGRSVHTDPTWSRPLGLLVSKREPEALAVPVRHAVHGWVYLLPGGGVQPI